MDPLNHLKVTEKPIQKRSKKISLRTYTHDHLSESFNYFFLFNLIKISIENSIAFKPNVQLYLNKKNYLKLLINLIKKKNSAPLKNKTKKFVPIF